MNKIKAANSQVVIKIDFLLMCHYLKLMLQSARKHLNSLMHKNTAKVKRKNLYIVASQKEIM